MSANFTEQHFIETWCEECARSIEMFSGSKALVTPASASGLSKKLPQTANYLWSKQKFESAQGTFITWVGTPEPTWSTIGSAMADDSAGAQQIYLEVIGQAQQGAATLLSRTLGGEVRCEPAAIEQICTSTCVDYWEIKVNFANEDLAPLIYSLDASAMSRPSAAPEAPKALERTNGTSERSYGTGIDQFLDLELPLSVVLGRRVMQIQDVLKLTSGSVVELDTTVSDRVEVIVQGKIVARGEVVSVKGNYGVRITDLVHDRMVALN